MLENIASILQEIGLTDGESKTYIALVSLGTSSVGPIVEKSGISMSKAYDILNRLMHKGLVSMIVAKEGKLFTAASPSLLLEYISLQEKRIADNRTKIMAVIPTLEGIRSAVSSMPMIETGIGRKGFEAFLQEMIDTAPIESMYYASTGLTISYKLQSVWPELHKQMEKKNIICRMVYDYNLWYEKDPKIHRRHERKNYYPIVLPKKYSGIPNITILGSKALISNVNELDEISCMIIRNKTLVEEYRKMFYILYDQGSVPEGYKPYPGDEKAIMISQGKK